MSVNLSCEEVELHQTPTKVTYKCYFKENGKTVDNPQNILNKYLQWLEEDNKRSMEYNKGDKVWQKMLEENFKNHAAKLQSFETLHFSIS